MPPVKFADRTTREIDRFEKGFREIERPVVEKHESIPCTAYVDVPKPNFQIHEKITRIEDDEFKFTVEKPFEFPQQFYQDKVVYVDTPITLLKPVLKKEVRELINEVPKLVTKTIDRVVEVPEIRYVDKFKEVPEVELHVKYIPKRTSRRVNDPRGSYVPSHTMAGVHPQFYSPEDSQPADPSMGWYENYPPPDRYPAQPIIDLDVPVPISVPVYYDLPLDVPIERQVPTPVIVGERTHRIYKEDGQADVEVLVGEAQYVRTPTPPHLKTHRGSTKVTGYVTLDDDVFHPLPSGDVRQIPGILFPPATVGSQPPATVGSQPPATVGSQQRLVLASPVTTYYPTKSSTKQQALVSPTKSSTKQQPLVSPKKGPFPIPGWRR